jgi:hypothetical protein
MVLGQKVLQMCLGTIPVVVSDQCSQSLRYTLFHGQKVGVLHVRASHAFRHEGLGLDAELIGLALDAMTIQLHEQNGDKSGKTLFGGRARSILQGQR